MVNRLSAWVWAIVTSLCLGAAAAAQPQVVTVTAKAQKASVVPGDQIAIAVVFDHEEGWHIHPSNPVVPKEMGDFTPIKTEIILSPPPGAEQWEIQWPEVHDIEVTFHGGDPVKYGVYEGRAVAYIPVRIPETAQPGSTLTFEVLAKSQACDDSSCTFPEETPLKVELAVVTLAQQAANPVPADVDFAGFDALVFAKAPLGAKSSVKPTPKPVCFDAFGIKFCINPAGFGFVVLLIVAAFGGFLLNFTPCVLPVLPLKIMGISAAAGHPARCLYLGTIVSLGVIGFWMVIGAAIAFISGFTAISSLFQTPWFSIGVGLFILFMAIGMLGAFVVQLPKAVYMINPNHETAVGSFFFGVMTAVLSTPCTAPFMGSAAAWAATQNPFITLATFGAIGCGMALPYLVLSAFPRLVQRVPRTGPASELIKQVMGVLLVGIAIFFLGTGVDPLVRNPVDPPVRFFWWIIAGLAVTGMLWLIYRTYRISKRPIVRLGWSVFGGLFAALSVMVAIVVTDRGPIPWIGYTPERLTQQLSDNKVVVLDFTAEWCLTCKLQEAAVLHKSEIVALLNHPEVVPMKVDLTGNNVPGRAKLKELNWVGIPLLAIYGPKATDPIKYDAYTTDMVKDAILRVGGPAAAPQLAKGGRSGAGTPPSPR
jgi:thiol:disulfide interchange protein